MPQRLNKSKFAEWLGHIINVDQLVTAQEIAVGTGYSANHIRNIANPCDPTEPSIQCAEKISSWLSHHYDEHRQLSGMHSALHEVRRVATDIEPDGSLKDEMVEMMRHLTHTSEELEEANFGKARQHINAMHEVMARIQAEYDLAAE